MNILIRILLLAVMLWVYSTPGNTQMSILSSDFCGHSKVQQTQFTNHSKVLWRQEQLENQRLTQLAQRQFSTTADFTLPVVFHIVHEGNTSNIPDSQVDLVLEQINQAYANLPPYDPTTGADTRIEFCLASRDPQGNTTTGITHTESSLTNMNLDTEDLLLKGLVRWDPLSYINIWVVNEICSSTGCGVAGYAFFPSSHGEPEDGIVMEASYVGTSPGNSMVLTHELAHYLGLYHTFEGGCENADCQTSGDRICDTPPDQSTAPVPCTQTANSCNTDVNTSDPNNPFFLDEDDLFINYMDYGNPDCYSMFTQGQVDRMTFFLQEARFSLLNSNACLPACLNPIVTSFSFVGNTEINIGTTINFNNETTNATTYQWLINGSWFSTATMAAYTFNELGMQSITLVAGNGDPNCEASYTITFNVNCNITSQFTLTQSPPYQITQFLHFNNNTPNANSFEWTVDGGLVGTANELDYSFNQEGVYEICLIAGGSLCQDTFCRQLAIQSSLDCSSVLDEDNDGLIGCYDPDCCESEICADNYYNECPIDCEFTPTLANFELDLEWASGGNGDWCAYNTPIVGDIDGDGVPEIIGKPCTGTNQSPWAPYPDLLVIDGITGNVEARITTPAMKYMMDAPAIADVDLDGYAEIFIQASNISTNENYIGGPVINGDVRRRILCYTFNGTTYVEKWMSEVVGGYEDLEDANTISIADFNEDGIAEIYIQNMIFNALDGSLIVSGGAQNHRGMKTFAGSLEVLRASSFSVAAEILSDNACANCDGLELVSGGMVYAVNLDASTPTMEVVRTAAGNVQDGWTSIADVDKDGDVDAIVAGNTNNGTTGMIYVWDLQTPELLYNVWEISSNSGYISQVNIADFDGDNEVEIGVCTPFNYRVLKPVGNQLTTFWIIDTDDWSGQSGSTVFDFNNDGASEVVYRTQSEILVLNGSTGTQLAGAPCTSGTRVEYPVVVDVDGDGETEVLCSCTNQLKAFGSGGSPWVKTRQIWNQHQYFNTNINDDLRIPLVQQAHHIVGDGVVLNNFLTQYGDQRFPAFDLSLSVEYECDENSEYLRVDIRICNEGNLTFSNDEILLTIYGGDATSEAITSMSVIEPNVGILETGDCFVVTEQMLPTVRTYSLNDNGNTPTPFSWNNVFPNTPIPECDYSNNYAHLNVGENAPPLELGPDITVCQNGVHTFTANPGFDHYQWQDGSSEATLTAFAPGTYMVTVTAEDGCFQQVDSVRLLIDPATIIELGPDMISCGTNSIDFFLRGFNRYQWFPVEGVDCSTCPEVSITTEVTRTYTVLASTEDGCYSVDSILIEVSEPTEEMITERICIGETFTYDGVTLLPGMEQQFIFANQLGCDSIINLSVVDNGLAASFTQIDTSVCEGSSIVFNNENIAAGTAASFNYQNFQGCDSIIAVSVNPWPIYFIGAEIDVCAGDSIFLDGQWRLISGIYQENYLSFHGCDSIHEYEVTVSMPIEIALEVIPTCSEDTTGTISTIISGGNSPYTYQWNWLDQTQPALSNLGPGLYELTVTDVNGCWSSEQGFVDELFPLSADIIIKHVDCYGDTDGVIQVDSSLLGLRFSLDGVNFQSNMVFNNLPQGAYTVYLEDEFGCVTESEVSIQEPQELYVWLPEDTTIILGCPVAIKSLVNSDDPLQYAWTPADYLTCDTCATTISRPLFTTMYELVITNEMGCAATDDILITVDKPRPIFIPNVFSPNGDGENDVFMIYSDKEVDQVLEFRVYDRWGELVHQRGGFAPNDPHYGWDGHFKNQLMNPGVFVYWAEVRFLDGETRMYSGDVTLLL